jgi:hypothetical protein
MYSIVYTAVKFKSNLKNLDTYCFIPLGKHKISMGVHVFLLKIRGRWQSICLNFFASF